MGKKIVRIVLRGLAVVALIAGGYYGYNFVVLIGGDQRISSHEIAFGFTGVCSTLMLLIFGISWLWVWAKESP